uniref:Uncharacterized protein n=1 Tax=Knipowitschia caucasica TaxID=637954 RepID=A0AAV2M3L8_KNICA
MKTTTKLQMTKTFIFSWIPVTQSLCKMKTSPVMRLRKWSKRSRVKPILTYKMGRGMELNEHAADINERFTQLLNSVNSIEEKVAALESNDCAGETYSKRRRRVHNPKLAEAVRRLHNSKTNPRRYEPEQGLISPHNEAVTSYLLKAVSESHDLHNVDKDRIVSACKTYYETLGVEREERGCWNRDRAS